MAERRQLGEMLVQGGTVSGMERDQALGEQIHGDKRPIGEILIRKGSATEEDVAKALAEQLKIPFVDPTQQKVDPVILWKLGRKRAESLAVIPMGRIDTGAIQVAMSDPRDLNAIRDMEFIYHTQVAPAAACPSRVHQAIARHYSMEHHARALLKDIDPKLMAPTTSPTGLELDVEAIQARLKAGGSAPYTDLFNFLLINAIQRKASDIHMEPQQDGLWVRYRIDGLLREVLRLPGWTERPLATRVKVVGRLEIYTHQTPQDGKVTANLGGRQIDLRISVIPSQYGEKIVIRLLDPSILKADLGALGWQAQSLKQYYRMVSQPQGLVLCVGPTGSGKSTTLYGTIHRLRNETTSIVTVEDPIEYSLGGVTQVQVGQKGGMHFETAIRSLLRQDPNVIVIGEIRDGPTVEAALEAANTGHLVLSTVHANHAISTISRLLDLGAPPYLLSATLSGVVAQRLVRQVCPNCSIPADPQPEDWQRLDIAPVPLKGDIRRVGPGCPTCRYDGYSGRIGVYEILDFSNAMRQLIADSAGEPDLWNQTRIDGTRSLLDDALDKVAQGITTLEEVARVVPVEPWRTLDGAMASSAPSKQPGSKKQGAAGQSQAGPPQQEGQAEELALENIELLDSDALERDDASPTTEEIPRGRLRILVADDAPEIRDLIAATLEDTYDIELAADGTEALALARFEPPDLVVLDVMMPGLTGFDVCEQLRAESKTATLPVLFLSARGERSYIKRGFKVGADDYLAKPFDPEELQLRVKALLRRAQ